MTHIAYYRVSDKSQTIASQKAALTHPDLIEHEYKDEGVSGAILAANRPGFAAMMTFIRKGDTLHVYALDRLGRDSIDVQTTVRALLAKGVMLQINNLGLIADNDIGRLMVAMLAQMAEMERGRIMERTAAGRTVAFASLAATGKTHKGKESMGRKRVITEAEVLAFRGTGEGRKSIAATAKHFEVSEATIKRCMNPATRKPTKTAQTA
jgi:putative DNA-invertase from lambdoid prophage Rac